MIGYLNYATQNSKTCNRASFYFICSDEEEENEEFEDMLNSMRDVLVSTGMRGLSDLPSRSTWKVVNVGSMRSNKADVLN